MQRKQWSIATVSEEEKVGELVVVNSSNAYSNVCGHVSTHKHKYMYDCGYCTTIHFIYDHVII